MAGLTLRMNKYLAFVFSTIITLYFLAISNAYSAQVTLAWDPNNEADLAGYKVHYGTISGNYQTHLNAGLNTSYTVTNLQDGGTYYLAVTAYDSSGNESGFSNEVSYTASLACTYVISPTSYSISSSGGAGTINVTAPSGCTWTAVSNSSWILITSNSTGTASGTIYYSVSANSVSASRAGTMTIAGVTFTLNQAGASCFYAISPTSRTFDSNGGAGTIGVTAPSGCSWNASSNADWISIISGNSGSGNGNVNFSVLSNSSTSSRSGTMTVGGQTFTANQSSVPQYTLSVSRNGTGTGSVINAPPGNSFSAGTVLTLTAAPDANSTFVGWSGACTGTSFTCSVTMNGNVSVTGTFNLKTYTISANVEANGSISPQGSVSVNYGGSQTFTITPNTGYQISDVKVDGVSVGVVTWYSISNVTANRTISATFAANSTYSLLVNKTGSGSGVVTNNPIGSTFNGGTAVTLTASPDASSTFAGWSGACTGTSPTCSITMNSNKSVTANFALKSYTITATAEHNGSISPSGSTSVNYGESKSFTIIPRRGYKILDVKVDGISIGAPNNYSFGNVKADHTIKATFRRTRYR